MPFEQTIQKSLQHDVKPTASPSIPKRIPFKMWWTSHYLSFFVARNAARVWCFIFRPDGYRMSFFHGNNPFCFQLFNQVLVILNRILKKNKGSVFLRLQINWLWSKHRPWAFCNKPWQRLWSFCTVSFIIKRNFYFRKKKPCWRHLTNFLPFRKRFSRLLLTCEQAL